MWLFHTRVFSYLRHTKKNARNTRKTVWYAMFESMLHLNHVPTPRSCAYIYSIQKRLQKKRTTMAAAAHINRRQRHTKRVSFRTPKIKKRDIVSTTHYKSNTRTTEKTPPDEPDTFLELQPRPLPCARNSFLRLILSGKTAVQFWGHTPSSYLDFE